MFLARLHYKSLLADGIPQKHLTWKRLICNVLMEDYVVGVELKQIWLTLKWKSVGKV